MQELATEQANRRGEGALSTVFLQTYGCQMNVLDSQLVREALTARGYAFVDAAQKADVVLLNTCSVRALSEQKVWSMLGRLAKASRTGPRQVVGVLGCMAEREAAALQAKPFQVDLICGPSELGRLPSLLDSLQAERSLQLAISGHTQRRSATRDRASEAALEALDMGRAAGDGLAAGTQAYVRITRGCNKMCAFCVVPFTRGPEVHRDPGNIVEEIQRLVARGVQEITLLGQTINHYEHVGKDGHKTSFAALLARIDDEVACLGRLRFLTSYPRDFTDEALDTMASRPRLCNYLHIPAQSGSDAMLRKMNRGYTLATYEQLIARARARMPNVRLAGDMIVGYPGETEQDHQLSLALLRRVRFKTCYIFKYSPRSGTVAARRLVDDVPDETKKRRHSELLKLQEELTLAEHQRRVGEAVTVLVDKEGEARPLPGAQGLPDAPATQLGQSQGLVAIGRRRPAKPAPVRLIGRSEGDEIVAFDGDAGLIGQLVAVHVEQATATMLYGRLAEPGGAEQG